MHPDALGLLSDDTHAAGIGAFSEYQRLGEDRRHLAAEIGELIAQLVAELVAAAWTEEQARAADVRALATPGAR